MATPAPKRHTIMGYNGPGRERGLGRQEGKEQLSRIVVCVIMPVENGLRVNLYRRDLIGWFKTGGGGHKYVARSLDEIFSKDFTDQVQKLLRDGRDRVPVEAEGS